VRMAPPGFAVKEKAPIAAILAMLRVKFRQQILSVLPLFALAALSLPAAAQGGPPFITNDPGTPGDGNWEINIMAYSERHPAARIFNAPILDLNYGVGSRIQLTYEVPYLVVGTDGGPTRSGLGKSVAGVKWRFYDSDEKELSISIFPQLEFNNPDSSLQRGQEGGGVVAVTSLTQGDYRGLHWNMTVLVPSALVTMLEITC